VRSKVLGIQGICGGGAGGRRRMRGNLCTAGNSYPVLMPNVDDGLLLPELCTNLESLLLLTLTAAAAAFAAATAGCW